MFERFVASDARAVHSLNTMRGKEVLAFEPIARSGTCNCSNAACGADVIRQLSRLTISNAAPPFHFAITDVSII